MFTLGGDGRLYSGDGHGDTSFSDTIGSLPFGYRMCAYSGFTLVNSTSSTSGSFLLLRTNCLSITLHGVDNHVCKEDFKGVGWKRRWNPNNISLGVVFGTVEIKYLIYNVVHLEVRSPIEYLRCRSSEYHTYTLPDNIVITLILSNSNRVMWRGFTCGDASLK